MGRINRQEFGTASQARAASPYWPLARETEAVRDAICAKNDCRHDQILCRATVNGGVPADQKAAVLAERMWGTPALERAIGEALVIRHHRLELVRVS